MCVFGEIGSRQRVGDKGWPLLCMVQVETWVAGTIPNKISSNKSNAFPAKT